MLKKLYYWLPSGGICFHFYWFTAVGKETEILHCAEFWLVVVSVVLSWNAKSWEKSKTSIRFVFKLDTFTYCWYKLINIPDSLNPWTRGIYHVISPNSVHDTPLISWHTEFSCIGLKSHMKSFRKLHVKCSMSLRPRMVDYEVLVGCAWIFPSLTNQGQPTGYRQMIPLQVVPFLYQIQLLGINGKKKIN